MPTLATPSRPKEAKLFRNNRSQAVRIPVEFELPGDRVLIHREGSKLIIEPVTRPTNIVELLACDGAGPEHLVRLTWYVVDRHDYLANAAALGAVYREILGRHYPAMTAVQVVALIEPGAVVEIEATAVVPDEPAL